MRYWWVNQKQTYAHEVPGGYLWSPKRKANNKPNPFYEFMREVAPGDAVLSYADGAIKAVGIAGSHAYEAPKPLEFGSVGAYWDVIGWRVDVRFMEMRLPVRPADHMDQLRDLLPSRYAPLRQNGHGLQNMYLTRLPDALAAKLIELLGRDAKSLVESRRLMDADEAQPAFGLVQWETHEMERVIKDNSIPETTRQAVVQARRGQGLFKQNVQKIESRCRLTLVDRIEHLRASHCKPWRDASNAERLDGENGLLLTPHVDHLFDRGFLTFEDDGTALVSPVAHVESLQRMGLEHAHGMKVGAFSHGQRQYLAFHRENVFLQSKIKLS